MRQNIKTFRKGQRRGALIKQSPIILTFMRKKPQKLLCGGLWKRIDRLNNEYFSGYIEINGERHELVVFKNSTPYENGPDIQIYEYVQEID